MEGPAPLKKVPFPHARMHARTPLALCRKHDAPFTSEAAYLNDFKLPSEGLPEQGPVGGHAVLSEEGLSDLQTFFLTRISLILLRARLLLLGL